MENTLSVTLMIAFLLIGAIGGAVCGPEKTITITETETIYQNVTIPEFVEVEVPINVLSDAVETFMEAVDDEEDEAGNEIDVLGSYDFDEVEVSKVYEDYSVEYTNDETTVSFKIKLRFDEDGEASEKETYEVVVYYEDGEDTVVEFD